MPLTKIQSLGITDGTIVNADINASAAIAGTKISGSFGKVLQVVTATDSTQRSTTSTSFVTGSNTLSITITPSSTSSKFAIFVTHTSFNANAYGAYTIYRNSTNLGGSEGLVRFNSFSGNLDGSSCYICLDSPSTTSSITYQPYMKTVTGNTMYMGASNMISQIIVMEIAS